MTPERGWGECALPADPCNTAGCGAGAGRDDGDRGCPDRARRGGRLGRARAPARGGEAAHGGALPERNQPPTVLHALSRDGATGPMRRFVRSAGRGGGSLACVVGIALRVDAMPRWRLAPRAASALSAAAVPERAHRRRGRAVERGRVAPACSGFLPARRPPQRRPIHPRYAGAHGPMPARASSQRRLLARRRSCGPRRRAPAGPDFPARRGGALIPWRPWDPAGVPSATVPLRTY